MEKLGKVIKINCKTVGEDSCFARFISLAACSFSYGIAHSEKSIKESLDIADDLFLLLAKGNKLDPKGMFDDKKLITVENYLEAAGLLIAIREGINYKSIKRPLKSIKNWT